MPTEPTIELTDCFVHDEPLGYLVLLHNKTMREYELFENLDDANICARRQERAASKDGNEKDWDVFPLYASHPLEN